MDLLNIIKEYWTIIVFVGAVIISWTRYESKNNAQDRDIKELRNVDVDVKAEILALDTKLNNHIANTNDFKSDIKSDITEIKTSLKYISEKLLDLKK